MELHESKINEKKKEEYKVMMKAIKNGMIKRLL
jgi:hypothetical protein